MTGLIGLVGLIGLIGVDLADWADWVGWGELADLVDSIAQGVDRTLRSNYAFVWDTISMPERDSCQVLEIPLDLDINIVAMAWNPRLPHRHILNHFFSKIRESGQLSRILRAHLSTKKANCWGKGEFRSMGLQNTIAAFALVAVSLLAAFLIFLLEVFVAAVSRSQ